ncbi:MAG: hypothetical protein KGI40_10230 [Xanthomonadaceae bacterium]|nr:hypothetical protein [Xanthomonadaceae bacterium]
MRLSAAAFRRLLALALLAWMGMVFASPLPAVQAATAMAHAAVMLHAGQPMAAHCADASAVGHDCCGHAPHACSGGHCCGCASACATAVLPVAAPTAPMSGSGRESLQWHSLALVTAITAPPLRPPAA